MIHVWEDDHGVYIVAINDNLEVKVSDVILKFSEIPENIPEKQSIESK